MKARLRKVLGRKRQLARVQGRISERGRILGFFEGASAHVSLRERIFALCGLDRRASGRCGGVCAVDGPRKSRGHKKERQKTRGKRSHQILRGEDLGLQAGEEAAPPCGLGLIGAGDGVGGAAFAQE